MTTDKGCDLVIRNALVLDGTGADGVRLDVAVSNGRITAMGASDGHRADETIDAEGLCLAPGFIDAHTHDDSAVIAEPDMLPKISQGVTTVIVGNCGISAACLALPDETIPDPLHLLGRREAFRFADFASYADAVDAALPAVNVAALVGHTSLRASVMDGLERPAAPDEIDAMRGALVHALDAGAIGMSSGLAYRNARHASRAEMDVLVGELGSRQRLYTTHLRDEFARLPEAMEEAFDTARAAGARLVISHLKCAGPAQWGNAPRALAALDAAALHQDCHCDAYPYTAGSSTLDPGQVTGDIRIVITWSDPHPEMARKDLADIAALWGVSQRAAAERLMPAGAVYHNMHEADMRQILSHPHTMVGSDGLPNDPFPHPRLYGTFPRVLGRYVRDERLMALPAAIHKMTGLSARNFGLRDRGVVRVGAHADLVLFDPERILDVADFSDPKRVAQGIERVYVNGTLAYRPGATIRRAGRMLRHGAA